MAALSSLLPVPGAVGPRPAAGTGPAATRRLDPDRLSDWYAAMLPTAPAHLLPELSAAAPSARSVPVVLSLIDALAVDHAERCIRSRYGCRHPGRIRRWLVHRLHAFAAAVGGDLAPVPGVPVPLAGVFGVFAEGLLLSLPASGFPVYLGDPRATALRWEPRRTSAGWALYQHGVFSATRDTARSLIDAVAVLAVETARLLDPTVDARAVAETVLGPLRATLGEQAGPPAPPGGACD